MAKNNKGTVGVIGLGIMGGSFAKNLTANGWRVIGYDPSKAAIRAARNAGVEISTSICFGWVNSGKWCAAIQNTTASAAACTSTAVAVERASRFGFIRCWKSTNTAGEITT